MQEALLIKKLKPMYLEQSFKPISLNSWLVCYLCVCALAFYVINGFIISHSAGSSHRDVAAAPQTPQLGGPRPTLGAQVSLKLLFGYVTIFSSADLFTTDLNCRKKLACDIISECNVILSRRI